MSTDALNISKSLSAENQLHEKQIQSLALLDTRLKDLGASFEQWKANSQAKHTEHEHALRLIDSVNQSTAGEISTIRESLRQGHESLHLAIKDIEKQADRTRSVLMETLRDVQQRFDKQSLSIQQLHDAMNAMSRGIEQSTHQNDASHRETRDRLSELQQTISPVAVISSQLSSLPVQIAGVDTSIQTHISKLRTDFDTILHRELAGSVEKMHADILDASSRIEMDILKKIIESISGVSDNVERNLNGKFEEIMNNIGTLGGNIDGKIGDRVRETVETKFKVSELELRFKSSEKMFVYIFPVVLSVLAGCWILYINREVNVNLTKQNGEKWQQEINRQADKEKHSMRKNIAVAKIIIKKRNGPIG